MGLVGFLIKLPLTETLFKSTADFAGEVAEEMATLNYLHVALARMRLALCSGFVSDVSSNFPVERRKLKWSKRSRWAFTRISTRRVDPKSIIGRRER